MIMNCYIFGLFLAVTCLISCNTNKVSFSRSLFRNLPPGEVCRIVGVGNHVNCQDVNITLNKIYPTGCNVVVKSSAGEKYLDLNAGDSFDDIHFLVYVDAENQVVLFYSEYRSL